MNLALEGFNDILKLYLSIFHRLVFNVYDKILNNKMFKISSLFYSLFFNFGVIYLYRVIIGIFMDFYIVLKKMEKSFFFYGTLEKK